MESTALPPQSGAVYRVLDANLNRLREALRVVEEYYRFIESRSDVCAGLKSLRHSLIGIEASLGRMPFSPTATRRATASPGRTGPKSSIVRPRRAACRQLQAGTGGGQGD